MKKSVSMVGVSAAIRDVEEEVDHAARSDAKVLITGESGVGKEIVARSIHERSLRSRAPLVTIEDVLVDRSARLPTRGSR